MVSVLFVSDFTYPNTGGVENHIYQLSQCLIKLGHKVYYLYRLPFYQQSTFPTLIGSFHMLRLICLRERITCIHAHQAFSTLGLEACLNAGTMGCKVVFTDHSLFGFADSSSIVMNKVLKCVLVNVHASICVSHTSKENTVLRACLPPSNVYVIPNAVNADDFTPALAEDGSPASWPRDSYRDAVTIVTLSRLVYRKGIDLLALMIPDVCQKHPNVNFIIGGDGPKRQLLDAMVLEYDLQDRVQLVGAVPGEKARDFLAQGHIFVNASLTEAFCIAIVEAASVGLTVVSTRVGGVPEVLPEDMIVLAEPSAQGLCAAVEDALLRLPAAQPQQQHLRVKEIYSWHDVALRTVRVYDAAMASTRDDSLLARMRRCSACGPWAGRAFAAVAALSHLYWCWLEWLYPAHAVEKAVDWPPSLQSFV